METIFRKFKPSDLSFMHKMLYEAVYWRKRESTPSFDTAMSDTAFTKALYDFGDKRGDIAVIAESEATPLGAAWIRYWNKEDDIRGYISPDIPILAIAVSENARHTGIGRRMIDNLINFALESSINKISLCVSKDNYAYNLYKQCGFIIYKDMGDSFIMLREVN